MANKQLKYGDYFDYFSDMQCNNDKQINYRQAL